MKENTKEIISYVFVGIMTTLVNYIVYFVLLMIHCHWLVANSISWFFAVIFAYYANKKYVFESQNDIKKELSSFVLLRFLTLIVENGCLYIFITLMHGTGRQYLSNSADTRAAQAVSESWLVPADSAGQGVGFVLQHFRRNG